MHEQRSTGRLQKQKENRFKLVLRLNRFRCSHSCNFLIFASSFFRRKLIQVGCLVCRTCPSFVYFFEDSKVKHLALKACSSEFLTQYSFVESLQFVHGKKFRQQVKTNKLFIKVCTQCSQCGFDDFAM